MKTINEIRLANARSLATEGPARFAEKLDITPQRANTMIGPNPNRNIGDAAARQIETRYGKEIGWLDHDHSSEVMVNKTSIRGQFPLLSNEALALIACVARLDDRGAPARKLFVAQQHTIEFAVELSRAQNPQTGRDDSENVDDFLTSWMEEAEGRRNAETRKDAR